MKIRINKQQGFTLIELLIVIAVIAILAVAILSAINPVEQLRKADDSRRRSDTAELLNSLERYYTTYRAYPWGAVSPTGACPMLDDYTGIACPVATTSDLQYLVDKAELKPEFANRKLNEYFVTENTTTNQAHVCFEPQSKTWKDEQVAKFGVTGANWSSGVRYVCVPE